MISRITRVIFLFALIGFSTINFQSIALHTSINDLTNESEVNSDNTFDMELFTALIYLLVILGFALFILILVVNQTHLNMIEGFNKLSNTSFANLY